MEAMKRVAIHHGLRCLLHEKPFAGVNGSGKHNNWSMSTDTGMNLLEPGDSPSENAQFLLFLCAVIAAVDEHQDLLRISAASAANDHRLGGNEAPPAIVSMFLGDELTEILSALEARADYTKVEKGMMNIGVDVLPRFPKDTTDRNRTSPFAFTGNKFEFRMPGSAFSVAGPNMILNTIVADELARFADKLENAEDFGLILNRIIRHTIRDHKRIIFNGNNYSEAWVHEAERRGLLNLKSTAEALPHLSDPKNLELFRRHGVFTETEIRSRQEILLEHYIKVIHIEALTMLDMITRDIMPAILKYSAILAENAAAKQRIGIDASVEKSRCSALSALAVDIQAGSEALHNALSGCDKSLSPQEHASYYREKVFDAMQKLRASCDAAELLVASEYWPYPSYAEMLFSIAD